MTSSTVNSKTERFRALSSLRFVAAILIVLCHFHYIFWPWDVWGPFEDFSAVVSFFLMLSGFMLTLAYGPMTWPQAGRFITLRLARIWPLHLLMLGVTFWLLPIIRDQTMTLKESTSILWASIFLLQAWLPVQDYFFSFNVITWYLSTLLACYLAFPLLIRNFAQTWPWKLGVGLLLLVGAFGLSLDKPLFAHHGISGQGWLYVSPLSRMFEFIVGMCAALFYQWLQSRYPKTMGQATVLEALALLLVGLAMASSSVMAHLLGHIPIWGKLLTYYASFAGATLFPFFLLLIVFAMERGYFSRLLAHPAPVLLGELSFGIYLMHVTLIHLWLYPVALKPHAPMPTPEKITIYFLVLLALSYCSWRFIEKPVAAFVARRFPSGPQKT